MGDTFQGDVALSAELITDKRRGCGGGMGGGQQARTLGGIENGDG